MMCATVSQHNEVILTTFIGIDPGSKGAFCKMFHGEIEVFDMPATMAEVHELLTAWTTLHDVAAIALEQVTILPRDSKRSGATFMRHVGALECLCELTGRPLLRPTPQQWGKGLLRAKEHARDKPSVEVVRRLYPQVDLAGLRGGTKDGRADAVLIALWASKQVGV